MHTRSTAMELDPRLTPERRAGDGGATLAPVPSPTMKGGGRREMWIGAGGWLGGGGPVGVCRNQKSKCGP
jgi:hypothetical protein